MNHLCPGGGGPEPQAEGNEKVVLLVLPQVCLQIADVPEKSWKEAISIPKRV